MKVLRLVAGYALYDHKTKIQRNNLCKLNYIIVDYRHQWTHCLLTMNDKGVAVLVHEYIPTGGRNVGQPRKRWEEANTHVNEKSPKMAYTLLLMKTPHWFCTFPLTRYHYGDDSTNQKLRCVCWLHTLHPIPTGRLFVHLFNSFRMGTGMPWGNWQLRPQLHAKWWTCIHKPACAIPWTLWFSNL